MSKHVRKILPLLLCLLLMACLLPAAYADLADSPEIEAVRAAITGGQTAYTINSGSTVTLAGELNIPADFTLALTNGSTMKIAHGACLSNSGILAISENARLNVAGTFVFNDGNGEVSLSSGSVIDVTGTAEINRPIRISDGSVRFIIEDGAVFNYGGFNIPENVEPYTVIQGVDLSVYSIHSNGGADRIYTSNRSDKPIRIEDMKSRSIYTIEFHGVDTYTLTESTEIPVFGNVPARVDMSETTLIVPAGMTLTVNGKLTVKELVANGNIINSSNIAIIGSPEAALRAAIADPDISGYRLENGKSITLGQNLTIPEGFMLEVIKGSKLVVPNGITLTVDGEVEVSGNARIEVAGKLADNNQINMMDSGVIDVTGTAEINRPIRISDDSARFIIEDGASFNYGGFNLRANMQPYTAIQGVDLSVYSIHSNGGDERIYTSNRSDKPIRIEEMKSHRIYTIEFHGVETYTLTESTEIPVFGNVPAKVDMSETTLIVPAGMTLTVNGELTVKELVENGTVVKGRNGVINGEASEIAAISEAIQSGETEYTIQNADSLTIGKDLVIPKGFKLSVGGGSMRIAGDATLTVNGELVIRDAARLDVAGKLMNNDNDIDGKGEIVLFNGGVIDASGTVELNRPARLGNENQFGEASPYFIIENGADFNMGGFNVQNSVDPYEAIRGVDLSVYSVHSNYGHTDRVYTCNRRVEPVDMERARLVYISFHGIDSYTLPTNSEIPVFENTPAQVYMNDTELIIPRGVTMTVRGELYVKDLVVENGGAFEVSGTGRVEAVGEIKNSGTVVVKDDGVLNVNGSAQVMGVLINNGSIDLMGATDLALVNGGVYSGGGTVTRGGEPYTIWNDPANADIRLPAGLKTLESQALANGDFFSVYIPAGTTTIVSDAFGNKAGMIIYGVPGSKAQTFAGNNNYLFAPVAPAA